MNSHTTILNTRIDALRPAEVVAAVAAAIAEGRRLRIGVVNAAKLVNMQSDSLLYKDVSSSDLVLADGMSVVWASRIIPGLRLPERVAGIDLMFEFYKLANEQQLRVFCLGASEEISQTVADNLARDYPSLILAGRRNGYFNEDEEQGVAEMIRDCKPHILLVAMTSPKKENFMGRWDDTMQVPIVHGVGGSFDVYAGKVERAPEAWQNLGMEWLYRVKQEPGRLWKRYLITNTRFIWLVMKEALTKLFSRN